MQYNEKLGMAVGANLAFAGVNTALDKIAHFMTIAGPILSTLLVLVQIAAGVLTIVAILRKRKK